MRKDPIQKKALRKVAQKKVQVEKAKREQKRRYLMGNFVSKAETAQRVSQILNQISQKKAV
jgi:coenzyme F420-reducing hydrogenase beta subunit